RGNDAHSLAEIDRRAAGKIPPVALGADAVAGLASEGRTDANLLDARLLESLDLLFLDQLSGLDDDLAGRRIFHVLRRSPAEHALPERHGNLARLDQGAGGDAGIGAAILLGNDAVLRHVDETPGQVTRVCRLQRSVGQALAGAVGRVEVLEHREPL